MKVAHDAIDTAAFFSFEAETDFRNRRRYFTINNVPSILFDGGESRKGIEAYAKQQGRFRHIFKDENKEVLTELQERLDCAWNNFAEFFGLTEKQSVS